MTGETDEPQYIPIYCLTRLTKEEQARYLRSITDHDNDVLPHILPNFVSWNVDRNGDLKDLYRKWLTTGGGAYKYHFAFFIDRQGVDMTSIIVAQPDCYTMLYSQAAENSATRQLATHVAAKNDGRTHVPQVEGRVLELLGDDIIPQRGLCYGRVPASSFRMIWANLDISNMSMSELVEYDGRSEVEGEGVVRIIESESWDQQAFVDKLERVVFEKVRQETTWVPLGEYTSTKQELSDAEPADARALQREE